MACLKICTTPYFSGFEHPLAAFKKTRPLKSTPPARSKFCAIVAASEDLTGTSNSERHKFKFSTHTSSNFELQKFYFRVGVTLVFARQLACRNFFFFLRHFSSEWLKQPQVAEVGHVFLLVDKEKFRNIQKHSPFYPRGCMSFASATQKFAECFFCRRNQKCLQAEKHG